MKWNNRAALALVLGCVPLAAAAQTSPSPIVPAERPDQNRAGSSRTQAAGPELSRPPAPLPQITPFQLRRVEVEGSTLAAPVLQAAWGPFVGQTIDGAALARVSDAVVAAYGRSDVALYTVLVPAQDFAEGVLRIQVLEGYVETVSLAGDEDPRVRSLVQRYLGTLTQERPLRRSTLQRYVSLTRDIPGLKTDLQFVTGAADQGVQLVATLDSDPVQVAVSVNNRGATFLGRTQVSADLYLNNLVAGGQSRLTLAAPTDYDRFQYAAFSHSQILGRSGATLQLNLGYLRTRPRQSDLLGHAASAGVQLTYPVIRSFTQDLYLTLGVDGLDADSAFLGSTFSDDRSRAGRFGAAYVRQASRTRLSLSGATSIGFDALGARTLTPQVTDLTFFKLNGRASFAAEVVDRLVLRLAAAGQWSDDRLPAAEQFALGGNEFGRGYEAAALIGDSGYAASAELAYRPSGVPLPVRDAEAYGFVDGGRVSYRGRFGAPTAAAHLKSVGAGVRGSVGEHLALQLEATRALSNPLPALDRREWRLIFAVRTVW